MIDKLKQQLETAVDDTEKVTKDHETLTKNLTVVGFDRWGNEDLIKSKIISIENQIQELSLTAESAEKVLSHVPQHVEHRRIHPLFNLINRTFDRFDQLMYVLRARLAGLQKYKKQAEVEERFGNVPTLLASFAKLEADNKRLRARELRFAMNPLLRRRNLTHAPAEFVHTLVYGLQNELSAHISAWEALRSTSLGEVAVLDAIVEKGARLLDGKTTVSVEENPTKGQQQQKKRTGSQSKRRSSSIKSVSSMTGQEGIESSSRRRSSSMKTPTTISVKEDPAAAVMEAAARLSEQQQQQQQEEEEEKKEIVQLVVEEIPEQKDLVDLDALYAQFAGEGDEDNSSSSDTDHEGGNHHNNGKNLVPQKSTVKSVHKLLDQRADVRGLHTERLEAEVELLNKQAARMAFEIRELRSIVPSVETPRIARITRTLANEKDIRLKLAKLGQLNIDTLESKNQNYLLTVLRQFSLHLKGAEQALLDQQELVRSLQAGTVNHNLRIIKLEKLLRLVFQRAPQLYRYILTDNFGKTLMNTQKQGVENKLVQYERICEDFDDLEDGVAAVLSKLRTLREEQKQSLNLSQAGHGGSGKHTTGRKGSVLASRRASKLTSAKSSARRKGSVKLGKQHNLDLSSIVEH
jgi:hypothetical protein